MYIHRPWLNEPAQDSVENRQTAGLVGIVVVLVILVASLFLVHQLRNATAIEDCLLAGRHNCDAFVTAQH